MKAIFKSPAKNPQVIEIDNSLEALQKAVGGYIETVGLNYGVVVLCDEEGKLKRRSPNIDLIQDIIVGNVLFVQDNGDGDFTDLSSANIARVLKAFSMPGMEVFK